MSKIRGQAPAEHKPQHRTKKQQRHRNAPQAFLQQPDREHIGTRNDREVRECRFGIAEVVQHGASMRDRPPDVQHPEHHERGRCEPKQHPRQHDDTPEIEPDRDDSGGHDERKIAGREVLDFGSQRRPASCLSFRVRLTEFLHTSG